MSYTDQYKSDIMDGCRIYFGRLTEDKQRLINDALNFSINKRYKEVKIELNDGYKKQIHPMTLRQMVNFIESKKPIMTSYGTLFMQHGTVPNPLADVIQSFLDRRAMYKKKMFEYPKGSTEYEYYNLMQSLQKVNANSSN